MKKIDDIANKVKVISTKELMEDLIYKYSILYGAKYFSTNGLQNYLVFFAYLVQFYNNDKCRLLKSMDCQKKVLKMCQTVVFLQSELMVIIR